MVLGALLDAGLPLVDLQADLAALNLPGWELVVQKEQRRGISGTHVQVLTQHEHTHRHLADISQIITGAALPESVKAKSLQVFTRLAQAEGKAHGIGPEEVHFHEVGAVDAIIDIVGSVAGCVRLGFDALFASPVHVGCGTVQAAHGLLPVPAPATAELLRDVPVYSTGVQGEMATPTGAAILKTLVTSYGPWPDFTVNQIGYGIGSKDFSIPNALRLAIGETAAQLGVDFAPELEQDTVQVLEANLDDMNPEFCGYVTEELLAVGALDVFITPGIMKKGRPGLMLTVITAETTGRACLAVIFKQTTTLGVRTYRTSRYKLHRTWVTVQVADEQIRVKLGSWQGETQNIAPEYEDCRQAAQRTGMALKEVYAQAKAAAAANILV